MNNCTSIFETAHFSNVEITKKMIQFVNPKIITSKSHLDGCQLYDINPQNFPDNLAAEAEKYPNSIYVAVIDQHCNPDCTTDCKSKMTAFYYINGVYIDRTIAEKVGKGGFGDVYKGDWHGKVAVFKFIKMNMKSLTGMVYAEDLGADLKKRLVEINKVPNDSIILKPLGHFRQQEQSLDQSTGKYIAENFEVIVSPKCRMDLEQFKTDEYPKLQDTNCDLLLFILKECLKR